MWWCCLCNGFTEGLTIFRKGAHRRVKPVSRRASRSARLLIALKRACLASHNHKTHQSPFAQKQWSEIIVQKLNLHKIPIQTNGMNLGTTTRTSERLAEPKAFKNKWHRGRLSLQPNSSKLLPAEAARWRGGGFAASRFQLSRIPWEQGRLQRFQGSQTSKILGLQGSKVPGIQGCKSSRVADFQGRVAEFQGSKVPGLVPELGFESSKLYPQRSLAMRVLTYTGNRSLPWELLPASWVCLPCLSGHPVSLPLWSAAPKVLSGSAEFICLFISCFSFCSPFLALFPSLPPFSFGLLSSRWRSGAWACLPACLVSALVWPTDPQILSGSVSLFPSIRQICLYNSYKRHDIVEQLSYLIRNWETGRTSRDLLNILASQQVNISTCHVSTHKHVDMQTCQHVNMSTCKHDNMQTCHITINTAWLECFPLVWTTAANFWERGWAFSLLCLSTWVAHCPKKLTPSLLPSPPPCLPPCLI